MIQGTPGARICGLPVAWGSPYLGPAMDLTTLRPANRRQAARLRSRMVRGAVTLVLLGAWPLAAQDEDAEAVAPEKPFSAMSRMLLGKQDSVVSLAREQVGLRYKYGAQQPGKAFDCSGLVQYVMRRFDVTLPRTAREQAQQGVEVPKDPEALKPGDLLYFGKGKKVTHIGIYVGEGRYVHAANRRKGVIESSLPKNDGSKRARFWRGVRRLFHLPDSTSTVPADSTGPVPVLTGTAAELGEGLEPRKQQ